MTISVMSQIKQRIEQMPLGHPFDAQALLPIQESQRLTVNQALSRLARAGTIERVIRGIYMRPEYSRHTGRVMPDVSDVVRVIAARDHALTDVHGAEAARRLGLSTQAPLQPVYLTDGTARQFNIGSLTVTLRRTSRRKLQLAGRPSGMALQALLYLGRDSVTPDVIRKVHQQLDAAEFDLLRDCRALQPKWLQRQFDLFAKGF